MINSPFGLCLEIERFDYRLMALVRIEVVASAAPDLCHIPNGPLDIAGLCKFVPDLFQERGFHVETQRGTGSQRIYAHSF